MENPITNLLQSEASRQLLKYAVGYAITCQCGRVMDCRRAVNIDVQGETGNTLRNFTVCADCFDRSHADLARIAESRRVKLELLDGRVLWPESATTPTTPKPRKTAAPKLELTPGRNYRIRLTSGQWTDGRLLGERVIPAFNATWRTGRATTHWRFINIATGRDVEIKSRQRIRESRA